LRTAAAFAAALVLVACAGEDTAGTGGAAGGEREVVVYTALDREFSEPILQKFEEDTGITVRPVYDTEAVKTVGLVNRLIAERDRPAADVFWNNEIVRSIQLRREGVTEPFDSPSAAEIPDELKDPQGHWIGFATRARVLAVNTERIPDEADYPTSVDALTDPRWQGDAAFAKPLFGTTSTHAAILWAEEGEDSMEFWRAALDNAVMEAGNAQARDATASGEVAWCMTDTDDAYGAIVDGRPVEIVYPDSGPGEEGLVLIPNTLVKIRNSPNPEEAQALIDYLLSPEVEALLAQSRSAQIPVRPGIDPPPGLEPIAGLTIREVDWEEVADALEQSQAALAAMLGEAQ
jgi:iron(III) transport system substrate-binding protein